MRRIARRTGCATLLVLAVVPGLGSAALAQGRPSSVTMTCAQAARLILSRGAVVLGTGGYTYDRYVRDRSFCEPTEIGRRALVPTRDNPACFIGYTCYEPGRSDRFGDF